MAPLIEARGVSKDYGGPRPLRLARLSCEASARLVIGGFGRDGAEMFVHLVSGAALPDEGEIRIDGVATRDITTDTAWLASLDRFGLVSNRAVLVEAMPIAANLALPLTLAVEPMASEVRAEVEALARDVELALDRLDAPASSLTPVERLRVHLARAVAQRPQLVLLEDPTRSLSSVGDRTAFGRTLAAVAAARSLGWLALSDDDAFAEAAAGERWQVDPATGEVRRRRRGLWPFGRSRR